MNCRNYGSPANNIFLLWHHRKEFQSIVCLSFSGINHDIHGTPRESTPCQAFYQTVPLHPPKSYKFPRNRVSVTNTIRFFLPVSLNDPCLQNLYVMQTCHFAHQITCTKKCAYLSSRAFSTNFCAILRLKMHGDRGSRKCTETEVQRVFRYLAILRLQKRKRTFLLRSVWWWYIQI